MQRDDLAQKYSPTKIDENCFIIQTIFRELHTIAHSSTSDSWQDDELQEIYLCGLHSFHDKISFLRREIEKTKDHMKNDLINEKTL